MDDEIQSEATAPGTFAAPDAPTKEPEGDMVTLRVGGLPFNTSYQYEEYVITRDGTEVPADVVDSILNSAKATNVQLEVVSQ